MKPNRWFVWIIRQLRDAVRQNFWLKMLSMALAVALWLFVAKQDKAEIEFGSVPVSFGNLAENMEIISRSTSAVSVRVRGPRAALSTLDPSKLRARAEDFPKNVNEGETILAVSPSSINTPAGVDVLYVSPSRIFVTLERTAVKEIEVQPSFRDHPPPGFAFTEYQVSPPTASVEAPRSALDQMDAIVTEPIDLSGWSKDFFQRAMLVQDLPNVRLRSDDRVGVDVKIQPRMIIRVIRAPIQLEPPKDHVTVSPLFVDILLRGPESALRELSGEAISAVAVMDDVSAGAHMSRIVITDLPSATEVLQLLPEQVKITVPEEAAAAALPPEAAASAGK